MSVNPVKWHTQESLSVSNSLPSMADMADPPTCPLGATDTTDYSEEEEDEDSEMDDWEPREPQSFNPHSLCEWQPPPLSGLGRSPRGQSDREASHIAFF